MSTVNSISTRMTALSMSSNIGEIDQPQRSPSMLTSASFIMWVNIWRAKFNANKTQALTLSRARDPNDSYLPLYSGSQQPRSVENCAIEHHRSHYPSTTFLGRVHPQTRSESRPATGSFCRGNLPISHNLRYSLPTKGLYELRPNTCICLLCGVAAQYNH